MFGALKNRLRGYLARRNAVVLAYHSVVSREPQFDVWHHMHVARFEEHIAYLAKNHHCISVGELLDAVRRNRIAPYSVAVTFDDGLANNLHVALPILERYGVPAAFFITTGVIETGAALWPERLAAVLGASKASSIRVGERFFDLRDAAAKTAAYRAVVAECKRIGPQNIAQVLSSIVRQLDVDESQMATRPEWDDFRTMTWDEVRRLARSPLVTIGAHTVTHPRLSMVEPEVAREEISACKQKLESEIGPALYFAYPNGGATDYTLAHRQMAIESGYRAAFSAQYATLTRHVDYFQIPRLGIGGRVTIDQLEYLMQGGAAFESNGIHWIWA